MNQELWITASRKLIFYEVELPVWGRTGLWMQQQQKPVQRSYDLRVRSCGKSQYSVSLSESSDKDMYLIRLKEFQLLADPQPPLRIVYMLELKTLQIAHPLLAM